MEVKAMQVSPPTVSWSFWLGFLSKSSLGLLPFSSWGKAQALQEDTTTLPSGKMLPTLASLRLWGSHGLARFCYWGARRPHHPLPYVPHSTWLQVLPWIRPRGSVQSGPKVLGSKELGLG